MKHRTLAVLIVAGVFSTTFLSTGSSQPPQAARRTIFSPLKVGQSVTLKERVALHEIVTVDEAGPLTHKVVEIGDDFIVLLDGAGVTETRIPVTAVRAVVGLKLKGK